MNDDIEMLGKTLHEVMMSFAIKLESPTVDGIAERLYERGVRMLPNAADRADGCPYKKIMELYNGICVSLPKILSIDGKRRDAVLARWGRYKSIETFDELFRIAEASDFLKGENGRNWRADFDWLMKATNFPKVLERRYDNRTISAAKDVDNGFECSLEDFAEGI